MRHGPRSLECINSEFVPAVRCGRPLLEVSLHPRLEPLHTETLERRNRLPFSNSYFALCQRGAMCRFHLACNFVISLVRGLADWPTLPDKLVPIDTTSLVDHFAP